jgi:hypothetical protein
VSRSSYGAAKKVLLDRSALPRPSLPFFFLAIAPSNLVALIHGHLLQFFLSAGALKPCLALRYNLFPPPSHIVSGHFLWQWLWSREDLLDLVGLCAADISPIQSSLAMAQTAKTWKTTV